MDFREIFTGHMRVICHQTKEGGKQMQHESGQIFNNIPKFTKIPPKSYFLTFFLQKNKRKLLSVLNAGICKPILTASRKNQKGGNIRNIKEFKFEKMKLPTSPYPQNHPKIGGNAHFKILCLFYFVCFPICHILVKHVICGSELPGI